MNFDYRPFCRVYFKRSSQTMTELKYNLLREVYKPVRNIKCNSHKQETSQVIICAFAKPVSLLTSAMIALHVLCQRQKSQFPQVYIIFCNFLWDRIFHHICVYLPNTLSLYRFLNNNNKSSSVFLRVVQVPANICISIRSTCGNPICNMNEIYKWCEQLLVIYTPLRYKCKRLEFINGKGCAKQLMKQ